MTTLWTPTPLPLNAGPPFAYSDAAISDISHTEAFVTGIDLRDRERCIVCGRQVGLAHCHIVPKVEDTTWEFLRTKGLIPLPSKSVRHEARNGVLMCLNHHDDFNSHRFYIRWEVTSQRFVLINHSRLPDIELFHGCAVRLFPGDTRTPFYGAFIDQEMRVRGRYPYEPEFADRPIMLPIPWQRWITDAPLGGGGDSGNSGDIEGEAEYRDGEREEDEENEGEHTTDIEVDDMVLLTRLHQSGERDGYNNNADNSLQLNAHISPPQLVQYHHVPHPSANHPDPDGTTTRNLYDKKKMTTITFRNPMTNPSELEAIMCSAHQQPSWKAAVMEGESWEGTAEENTAKYLRILPPANGP